MRRAIAFATLAVIVVGQILYAQDRPSTTPPIPEQERFVPRADLTATIRLSTDRVQVGELPRATLVLKNVGPRRMVIRKPESPLPGYPNTYVTVYSESGEKIGPSLVGIIDALTRPLSIRDMIALEPEQEYESPVVVPQSSIPQVTRTVTATNQIWRNVARLDGLPPGRYELRVAYTNAPDMLWAHYDVYESGAAQVWEGRVDAPPVAYTVVPPDEGRLRELMLTITGPGNADAAIRAVGLARAPRAADALVRRFQWDHRSRLAVVIALDAIGNADANSRLLEWIEGASSRVRYELTNSLQNPFVPEAISILMQNASVCAGARLDTFPLGSAIDTAAAQRSLAKRCPEFAARQRATLRVLDDAALSGSAFEEVLNRRRSAIAILGRIADPNDIPLLLAVARGTERVLLPRSDRLTASADLSRRAAYALGEIAWTHLYDRLREDLPDVVEGIPRDSFLGEVHSAIGRAPLGHVETLVSEATAATPAAALDLASTLRETYPAQRVMQQQPATPVVDLAMATVREMSSKLSDANPEVQEAALDFLIQHGDSSLTLRFVDLVLSPHERVRDRAIQALARFGTELAFLPLRNALVRRADAIATSIDTALHALTFTEDRHGPDPPNVAEWDAWWMRNRHFTRRQWADAVIDDARPDPLAWYEGAAWAVDYLAHASSRQSALHRAARSRSWPVRIAAATALVRQEGARDMPLLLRELDNRSLGACHAADEALARFLNVTREFNCGDPAQRQRAREFWERQIAAAANRSTDRRP